MPEHVSNPKGSLMLGYIKDGSDDEHLGEFCSSLLPLEFSHPLVVLSRPFVG